MYGMVNKAVEDMVSALHGEAMWEQVKERAGVDVDVFISNEGYPDEMTYRLVTAASELSGTPPSQLLEAFGEHWVLNTARGGYGELMNAGGKSLSEFLTNLPNFHARVSMIFPRLQPPRFKVSDVAEQSLHLHYFTHRAGLVPFVIGLLKGLGKMFNTPVKNVTLISSREQGAAYDTFLVEW
jgi:hypothetical protein